MVNLTPSNSRIASGAALLLLVAYLLPWDAFTDGTGTSRLSYLAQSFSSGFLFSGVIPFSYLALDLAIAGLAALVALKGLINARVAGRLVLGLAIIVLFSETYDFTMRVLFWGMPAKTYFDGMGTGRYLFYACMIALLVVSMGSKTREAARDPAPNPTTGPSHLTATGAAADMLEKSQMAGVAALALLGTLVLPWTAFGSQSRSMVEAMMEMVRQGNFGDAPAKVQLFFIAFFVTLALAVIVAFKGLLKKAVGKTLAQVTGGLGLGLIVIAAVALADMAGGLDRVLRFVGVGCYLFIACAAWLAGLGFFSQRRQS